MLIMDEENLCLNLSALASKLWWKKNLTLTFSNLRCVRIECKNRDHEIFYVNMASVDGWRRSFRSPCVHTHTHIYICMYIISLHVQIKKKN